MNIVTINRPDNKEPIKVGGGHPLLLIAGPCVLESEAMAREVAAALKEITERLSIPLYSNLLLTRQTAPLLIPTGGQVLRMV